MQDETSLSSSESPYRVAIDLTAQTIAQRARNYRNLVVTVVVVCCSCIVSAAWAWTLTPLVMFCLLLPAIGIFFVLDVRQVNGWHCRLTESWVRGDIDLHAVSAAVTASPVLPQATLQSMLSTLPAEGKDAREIRASTSTRQAVSEVLLSLGSYRVEVLALWAVGYAIVAVLVIFSVFLHAWIPLLGVALVVVLPIVGIARRKRLFNGALRKASALAQEKDFSASRYAEMIASMDWQEIQDGDRDRFFACSTQLR